MSQPIAWKPVLGIVGLVFGVGAGYTKLTARLGEHAVVGSETQRILVAHDARTAAVEDSLLDLQTKKFCFDVTLALTSDAKQAFNACLIPKRK